MLSVATCINTNLPFQNAHLINADLCTQSNGPRHLGVMNCPGRLRLYSRLQVEFKEGQCSAPALPRALPFPSFPSLPQAGSSALPFLCSA